MILDFLSPHSAVALKEHVPCLLEQVLHTAAPAIEAAAEPLILDATFGRGGYSRAILENWPHARVCAIDCDPAAVEYAQKHFAPFIEQNRFCVQAANFNTLPKLWPDAEFALIVFDLGPSSPQLDTPQRGFSFYKPGPLDMRMDPSARVLASDIINTWPAKELEALFKSWGEVHSPYKVVRNILKQRKIKPIMHTHELAELIIKSTGWQRSKNHPATRYFLALRIAVNSELDNLSQVIAQALDRLKNQGRLLVVSFHSLEGRIVKEQFKKLAHLGSFEKKAQLPSWEQKQQNPRTRSAQLRVFTRTKTPARGSDATS